MSVMKNYSMQYNITQPYRSYGCLWEAIETVSICNEMESLEQQLKTTAIATRMLKDIGVNVK